MDRVENFNFVLTAIIILLSLYTAYLAKIQASPAIEQQRKNELRAYNFCKEYPDSTYPNSEGKPLKCTIVVEMLENKFRE